MEVSLKKTAVFILLFMFLLIFIIYKSYDVFLEKHDEKVINQKNDNIINYLEITGSSNGFLLKNGNRLFLSRGSATEETVQLFVQSKDKIIKITSFQDAVDSYFVSPDEKHIAFLLSEGGNEQNDIYLIDIEKEYAIKTLLKDKKIKYDNIVWADNNTFLFVSNEVNGSDFYIYSFDITTNTQKLLVEKSGYNIISDALNAEEFIFYTYLGNNITEPYLYKKNSFFKLKGAVKNKNQTPVAFFENNILLLSNENNEFNSLELWNRDGNKTTIYSSGNSVESVIVDKSSYKKGIFCINEDGFNTCHQFYKDEKENIITAKIDLPEGIITLSQLTEKELVFTSNTSESIPSPVIVILESGIKEAFGYTYDAGINTKDFVKPKLIKTSSFDGTEIPFFAYIPKKSKAPYKTIIYFHGGPESQFRPFFITTFQYYINQGYMVIAPNVRGSSGYGQKYRDMDNYKKRMDSVKDAGAIIEYLLSEKLSQNGEFIAMGGSYGGFMTVASMAEYNSEIKCGIDSVGVVDFLNFLNNTKAYRRKLREVEYGPLSDPEFLKSISPTNMTEKITGKLMVAHGENDPRVPVSDAYILINKLKSQNKQVESLIFEDEGHGFRKKKNRIEYYSKSADFIKECYNEQK